MAETTNDLALPPTLDELAIGRDNNFNLIRIVAACWVLVSHAYPIALGNGAVEPLDSILQMSLGTLGVLTFFVISGFFISQSFDRRRGELDFWIARCLRIFPALVFVLLLTVFALGPFFTTARLHSYFSEWATVTYIPRNLSLKWLQYDLPGVFASNPYPATINGSLWTLFYEAACYFMVALIGMIGLAKQRRFVIFLGAYAALYIGFKVLTPLHSILLQYATVANFHELTLPFVIGMAFYQYKATLRIHMLLSIILLLLFAISTHNSSWFREVFVCFWCYVVFCFGYVPSKNLRSYNRVGDYSYGTYIFAFPCEQAVVAIWPGISPVGLIFIALPVTLLFAVTSWHLLESKALSYRKLLAARIIGEHNGRKFSNKEIKRG